jgi:hypothetical protein
MSDHRPTTMKTKKIGAAFYSGVGGMRVVMRGSLNRAQ